jgi:malto-oligosyltrehalose trehalohydrolase
MPFGARLGADGTRFRLWAPAQPRVELELDGGAARPMRPLAGGWHELIVAGAAAGTRYRFVLPDGVPVADPASRFQPDDVHGLSEVIDPGAYAWAESGWRGRPWHEAVLYELHVGAFTPAGTFAAAAERLDELVALGVTGVELMPLAAFPGRRNWGYDGVLPFAPDASYGRPEELKALVDAAHARGLMVLLDVVYNHFGPEGNYLRSYAPAFFTDRHHTPWGSAIDFDGPDSAVVREFFIHNALYWLEEYRLDGLRIDAVHAIYDDSPNHIVDELCTRARAAHPDRPVHLVLENERNEVRRLNAASAQWNDDVHHVLHVAVTGEAQTYYRTFRGDGLKLGRALAEGFARGDRSDALPPSQFVAFLQNHDQVGNRAFGERITALAPLPAVRAAAAAYLLLPQIPMLFMGEEWASSSPFPFFCDFSGQLADAVRAGRQAEFGRTLDPIADATFAAAKLDWDERAHSPHAAELAWYRAVLAVRRAEIVPRIPRIVGAGTFALLAPSAATVRWSVGDDETLVLTANLSASPVAHVGDGARTLWQEGALLSDALAPWSVRVALVAGPKGPAERSER